MLCLLFEMKIVAQSRNQAYINYIQRYFLLAQQQQQQFGIPASITLAQGLLESGAGLGKLALISNNHFGIKCSDWQGEKVFHDDDMQGECFRKYDEVVQSFEDHSVFLKTKQRYAFLFDLSPTDYQGWALGLKKAGYATDPNYAVKLINIIQDYELGQYDVCSTDPSKTKMKNNMPVTNNGNGQFFKKQDAMIHAFSKHEIFKVNGVEFVVSLPDDTYESISNEFEISVERLFKYNDIKQIGKLKAGTRLFVQQKKCGASRQFPTHKVMPGETIYRISQNYGIKLKRLLKLNGLHEDDVLQVGQILKLRIKFLFF